MQIQFEIVEDPAHTQFRGIGVCGLEFVYCCKNPEGWQLHSCTEPGCSNILKHPGELPQCASCLVETAESLARLRDIAKEFNGLQT